MNTPEIDKAKLKEAMEIIDRAAFLIDEKDYEEDEEVKNELTILDKHLKELSGNDEVSVYDFQEYWDYDNLETVAEHALMPKAEKQGMSDKEIEEVVRNIYNAAYPPAQTDYWLKVLEKETRLENISDYIFWPNEIGLDLHASEEEIINKIFEDRNK